MSSTPAVPPYLAVLEIVVGHWPSYAVCTVAKLGIADQLEAGPKTTAELAAALNLHEDSLYRVLRALAGIGVFHEGENRTFSQTAMSDVLRTNATPSLRFAAGMLVDDWNARSFQSMAGTIANGASAVKNFSGTELFDYLATRPEEAFRFNRGMTDLSSGDAPAVLASYDFSGFEHIVDVAGGAGKLLAGILGSAPKLRGTLFDMPSVIEQAKADKILDAYSSRCELVAGSFFEAVPQGADAYIMKHIIHDWDAEHATKILRHCRSAMRPNGKLLVADRVLDPPNAPDPKKFFDVAMMLIPGGRERTEQEWHELYAASGFRVSRIIPTPGPLSIIEGLPV